MHDLVDFHNARSKPTETLVEGILFVGLINGNLGLIPHLPATQTYLRTVRHIKSQLTGKARLCQDVFGARPLLLF